MKARQIGLLAVVGSLGVHGIMLGVARVTTVWEEQREEVEFNQPMFEVEFVEARELVVKLSPPKPKKTLPLAPPPSPKMPVVPEIVTLEEDPEPEPEQDPELAPRARS